MPEKKILSNDGRRAASHRTLIGADLSSEVPSRETRDGTKEEAPSFFAPRGFKREEALKDRRWQRLAGIDNPGLSG